MIKVAFPLVLKFGHTVDKCPTRCPGHQECRTRGSRHLAMTT